MIFSILLNRLRGTWSWFRPIYAFCIALVAFILTGSWVALILVFALAWGGNCMGWGDWDCIATNRSATKPIPYTEGDYNGIQWLAEKIIASSKDWLNHCRVCLVIMGIYRAAFMLPLIYWLGLNALSGFILLIPAFLIASEVGYLTTKIWNFNWMTGGWEHQEVWYGLILGVTLIGLGV